MHVAMSSCSVLLSTQDLKGKQHARYRRKPACVLPWVARPHKSLDNSSTLQTLLCHSSCRRGRHHSGCGVRFYLHVLLQRKVQQTTVPFLQKEHTAA